MLKLIILLAFVVNLNCVLTDQTSTSEYSSFAESHSSASSSSSSYSSSSASASETSANNNNNNNKNKKHAPACGPNEVPSDCANSPCIKNCAQKDLNYQCRPNPASCKPGCVCADTYLRDDSGTCIPSSQCPPNCDENEVYSDCPGQVCQPQTCDEVGFPLSCYQFNGNTTNCGKPRCICKGGYVKDENGKCISARDCPSCGGDPNAWYGCGTFCTSCSNYKNKNIACILSCKLNGCDCRPNYVYNDDTKKCVLPSQCPPVCGRNEVASNCVNNPCIKKNCAQKDLNFQCKSVPSDCKAGCLCVDGYLRADNGTCVPINQCPSKVCGVNEIYYSCPVPLCAAQICENAGKRFNCPLIPSNYTCKAECRCRPGYFRNNIGQCISEEECKQCGDNENYELCPATCPPRTCETKDRVYKCKEPLKPGDPNCAPDGCRCADNYYRNSQGKCVLKEQCPNCGPNEVPSDCINGGCDKRNCSQLGRPDLCIDLVQGACKKGCVCKDGYLRTDAGVCVPRDKCPSKEVCPKAHEYYDKCPPSCPARKCGTDDRLVRCRAQSPDDKCNPSCRCEAGYYRNSYGDCVTFEECSIACSTNEIYDPCPKPSCAAQTCENIDKIYNCPLIPTNYTCKGECRCQPGYYRNKIGNCISEEQCKSCTGPNEFFSCGGACDNECDKLNEQNQTDCHIINIKCNEMCYCEDGYARNAFGICIPISQCPPKCSENEQYSDCPNKECRPMTCDDLGYPLQCDQLNNRNNNSCDKPRCICKSGFVRNKKGVCISTLDCPSCGGDPNAESGCGTFCTRCTNYKNKAKACPASCLVNGCDCRKNYVYDASKKKCVLPEQCPLVCGPNEVSSNCANNPCIIKNCTQKDLNFKCRPKQSCCKPGCLCADGYLRANNGTCIKRSQCPQNCGPNEVPSDCINGGCDKRNCSQLGRPGVCIDLVEGACKKGCVCQSGYLRTAAGVCVPSNKCPSKEVCSKPHEYYDMCPPSCPARKCGTDDRTVLCKPPPPTAGCNAPSCRCENGYYRNLYGDCVTFEECSITCGSNEIYYPCPAPSCAAQTCENIGRIILCPRTPTNYTCKGECRCQPGFYRNKIGQCISEEECKRCQGPNEYYSCGGACDNECDKLSQQNQTNCPIVNVKCNEMCYCEDNYARNASGICIPISECPLKCNKNEEYSDCPNKQCRAQRCDELGFPLSCEQLENNNASCEKPRCICKSGLVKNQQGECISPEDCPSCGGDSNARPGCGVFCTKCSNYKNTGRACPLFCKLNGCDCRQNYVYDESTKKCVLPEQCPQESTTPGTTEPSTNLEDDFSKGNALFTAKFFEAVVQNNPGQSVVMSAYSALLLLAQVALFAIGQTRVELLEALNLKDSDAIITVMPIILKKLREQKNATIRFAGRNYGSDSRNFSETFKKETLEIFNAEAENLDFSNPQKAAEIINEWVSEVTYGKINNLISPELLGPSTELVMVNALYVLAEWSHKFNKDNTRPGDFYTSSNTSVTLDIMHQVTYLEYAELPNLDAKAVELTYINKNVSCLIVLPNKRDGASKLVTRLKNITLFNSVRDSLKTTYVDISLPKFKTTTTTNWKDVLPKIGVTQLLNPNSAELVGILADGENISGAAGVQKAVVEVNESGTEATAANAFIGVATAAIEPPRAEEFNADHSFLYYLTLEGNTLFCGLYRGN